MVKITQTKGLIIMREKLDNYLNEFSEDELVFLKRHLQANEGYIPWYSEANQKHIQRKLRFDGESFYIVSYGSKIKVKPTFDISPSGKSAFVNWVTF